jgi:hypothetical protein
MTTKLQDCPHPRARHQHGTHLAYQKDHCRCEPCLRAASRQHKRIAYRTHAGTHTYVDAAIARDHVQQLLATLTVGQIEQRSGVHRTAIRVLVGDFPGRPASKRITRTTHAALLALRPVRVGPETSGLVDRCGTQRRLRALIALGWTARYLTRRLGMSSRTMGLLTADIGAPVQAATRARVATLYDELALTIPAPSRGTTIARNVARRNGWAPPLAWDDDTIDDPDARPDLGQQTGELAWERVLEDYQDTWDAHAGNIPAAAQRLGISERGLVRNLAIARSAGRDVTFTYARAAS